LALLATPNFNRNVFIPKKASPPGREGDSSAELFSRASAACEELRRAAAANSHPPPPPDVCEELYMAVERAARKSTSSMGSLRTAVARFTTTLRDDGATPEKALVVLKSLINSRTFVVVDPYPDGEDLRQQITTWSIEEFFKEKK
jgi:hypothetical protein